MASDWRSRASKPKVPGNEPKEEDSPNEPKEEVFVVLGCTGQ